MYLVFTTNWGHNKKIEIIYEEELNNVYKIKSMWHLLIVQ